MKYIVTPITDINQFLISTDPAEGSLVIYEDGKDPIDDGMMLYGYDEIGDFDHYFKKPRYCLIEEKETANAE